MNKLIFWFSGYKGFCGLCLNLFLKMVFLNKLLMENLLIWIIWRKFLIWYFCLFFLKMDFKKFVVLFCVIILMLFWWILILVEDKVCRCRILLLMWMGILWKKFNCMCYILYLWLYVSRDVDYDDLI